MSKTAIEKMVEFALSRIDKLKRIGCGFEAETEMWVAVINEARRLSLEAKEKPLEAGKGYWWCPECKEEVPGARVTNAEFHDVCGHPVIGKVIVDDMPTANAELVEALADLEHRRWASWQKYVHNLSPLNEKGERVIPASSVEHWERQIVTKYKDLTEYEKGMDRKEVYKTLEVLSKYLPVPVVKEQGEAGLTHEAKEAIAKLRVCACHCSACKEEVDVLRRTFYELSRPSPVASGLSTADLIAELEKRRPTDCANRCEYIGSEVCGACIWGLFIGEEPGGIKDNFNLSK